MCSRQTGRRNLKASKQVRQEIPLRASCDTGKSPILRVLEVRQLPCSHSSHQRSPLTRVPRSKLSANPSLRLPHKISAAIANITEGFSFAYLQEAFVTALLSIVQTQRKTTFKRSDAEKSKVDDDLESKSVWQAISQQVQTLRNEMKDSKKSVQDAEKNSVLSDAKSDSGTATGFGLGR